METTIILDDFDSASPDNVKNNTNGKRNSEVLNDAADDSSAPATAPAPAPAAKKSRIRKCESNVQQWDTNDQQCSNEPQVGNIEETLGNSPAKLEAKAKNQDKLIHTRVAGNVGSQADSRGKSRGFRGGGNGGGGNAVGGGNSGGSGSGGGGNRFSGGGNSYNNYSQRNDEFFIYQRLRNLSGPTLELESMEDNEEFKFSGRNRLYVGNLSNEIHNEEFLRELFKPYGELGDIFLGTDTKYAFVKVDYHANAEKAKRALDGSMVNGRQLRVRFAPCASIVRVRNLTHSVSNELLYKSFEVFGPIERAIISVDDRGTHMGEGIVEFTKKSSANACLRMCHDKCFFLTASLRPCIVETKEMIENVDGMPEKTITKNNNYKNERSVGPRFGDIDSFDHEYGVRWKELHAIYNARSDALKREMKLEEEKLEAQLEFIRYERETHILRQELRKREADNERMKVEWEMRQKQMLECGRQNDESYIRYQNDIQNYIMRQELSVGYRQQDRGYYMQDQPIGFTGVCDYATRTMNMENSPFVVFGDTNNTKNKPELGQSNQGIFPSNIDVNNKNANLNQEKGLMSENNALWGRRSM